MNHLFTAMLLLVMLPPAFAAEADLSISRTGTRRVTPGQAEHLDDVLFSDVWARPGLSRRDRSLVTVSALIAMNRPEQLRSHLKLGLDNGMTKDELTEAMTQLAFYAGWPNALSAVGVAREVFASQP